MRAKDKSLLAEELQAQQKEVDKAWRLLIVSLSRDTQTLLGKLEEDLLQARHEFRSLTVWHHRRRNLAIEKAVSGWVGRQVLEEAIQSVFPGEEQFPILLEIDPPYFADSESKVQTEYYRLRIQERMQLVELLSELTNDVALREQFEKEHFLPSIRSCKPARELNDFKHVSAMILSMFEGKDKELRQLKQCLTTMKFSEAMHFARGYELAAKHYTPAIRNLLEERRQTPGAEDRPKTKIERLRNSLSQEEKSLIRDLWREARQKKRKGWLREFDRLLAARFPTGLDGRKFDGRGHYAKVIVKTLRLE